jgi:hypothetical protein
MKKATTITLALPEDMTQFSMPPALMHRLIELLDRIQTGPKLTSKERREAEAIVELSELLSLLRLQVIARTKRKAS